MKRREFLTSSVVGATGFLAGCPTGPATTPRQPDTTTGTGANGTTSRNPLTGTTVYLTGRVARYANGTLFVDADGDDPVPVDVADNAGPLVCSETGGGTLDCVRRQDWSILARGDRVCATVRPTGDRVEAVKIFVNAVCTMQPPPDGSRQASEARIEGE